MKVGISHISPFQLLQLIILTGRGYTLAAIKGVHCGFIG
jgi:hypothetical protein